MDLQPSDDESQVIDSAAKFIRATWPIKRLHALPVAECTPEARRTCAELGWLGIGVPQSLGGAGFSSVEELLFFREMGRYLAPTNALAISLAARVAGPSDSALSQALLGGGHGVALCVDVLDTQVSERVRGRARAINVEGADLALLFAADSALLVDLSPASILPLPCLDKSVTMAELKLSDAIVRGRCVGGPIATLGSLFAAAMLVGICESVTQMIVDYAQIRQTFGRPIGAYQAVRHPCAEMAVRTEVARAQLFYAGVAVRDELPDAGLQVEAAKSLANAAALQNVDLNIQLHGGIGTTDDHDAHLYMKRAHLLSRLFGTEKSLARRIVSTRMRA